VAAGIDSSGALLVDTADGQVTLDAGEVHLQRD
jgi:biotin protein ligase-like protein